MKKLIRISLAVAVSIILMAGEHTTAVVAKNPAEETNLIQTLRQVQRLSKQPNELTLQQQIIALMSSYHVLTTEGKHREAHQAFAKAFELNAKVTDTYIKGRNYFQFMCTDLLDSNRDEVINRLNAREIWRQKDVAAYWDNQWSRLEVEFTQEWVIKKLLEALKPIERGELFEFGQQVSYFARTHQNLASRLPLPESVARDKLFEFAEQINYLMLLERALLRAHQLILTQHLDIRSQPFDSVTDALKKAFPKLTLSGQLTVLLFTDFHAEKVLKRGEWASAEHLYSLSTSLLGTSSTQFHGRNYFGAKAWLQRAHISIAQGQLAATEHFLEPGLQLAKSIEDHEQRSEMLGFYYRYAAQFQTQVGNLEVVNEHLRNAIKEFTSINHHNAVGCWAELAQNLDSQGKPRDALVAANDGLNLAKSLEPQYPGGALDQEKALLYLAKVQAHFALEDWQAMKGEIGKGLDFGQRSDIKAHFLVYQGLLQKQLNQQQEALQSFLAARALRPIDEQSRSTLLINLHIGLLYDEAGKPRSALPFLERALTIHVAMRKSARSSEAYRSVLQMSSVGDIADTLVKVTYDLLQLEDPDAEIRSRQLLYYSELMKARSMTDEIESMRRGTVIYMRPGVAKQIPEELKQVLPMESTMLPMKLDASEIFEDYKTLVGEMTQRHQRPTVFLEYVPVPAWDKVLLYVIDNQSVSWVELEASWSEICKEIADFRKYIIMSLEKYTELYTAPVPDERIVNRIMSLEQAIETSSMWLGKVLLPEKIPDRAVSLPELLADKSLIVFPHGPMHNMPLAALKVRAGDRHLYLVDIVSRIAASPSYQTLRSILSLYKSNLEQRVNNVLLVGDETGRTLSRVRKEFMAIRSVFDHKLHVTASKEKLKALAQKSPAVHFAVHGRLNREHPFKSGLGLRDGALTLGEIIMFEAFRTRIVTMAACEAAEADITDVGDDVWSLATGFMFAGVPAVIGAQWKQDDQTAAEFYAAFYKAVADNPDVGGALHTAVIRVREAKNAKKVRGLLNRKNPAFWAGFHFLGE